MVSVAICGSEQLCYLCRARPPGEQSQPPFRLQPVRGFLIPAAAVGTER